MKYFLLAWLLISLLILSTELQNNQTWRCRFDLYSIFKDHTITRRSYYYYENNVTIINYPHPYSITFHPLPINSFLLPKKHKFQHSYKHYQLITFSPPIANPKWNPPLILTPKLSPALSKQPLLPSPCHPSHLLRLSNRFLAHFPFQKHLKMEPQKYIKTNHKRQVIHRCISKILFTSKIVIIPIYAGCANVEFLWLRSRLQDWVL